MGAYSAARGAGPLTFRSLPLGLWARPALPYDQRTMTTERIGDRAAPAVEAPTLVTRSPSVVATAEGDTTLMMHLDHGRYFTLDAIGGEVWRRIETPCTFGALVDGLAADYDAQRPEIARDVAGLLGTMAAAGVVTLDSARQH